VAKERKEGEITDDFLIMDFYKNSKKCDLKNIGQTKIGAIIFLNIFLNGHFLPRGLVLMSVF
jgi:hypothetical protein